MIILKYVIIICREGGVHMFAKDVLRILQVSRPTLTKYVKTGIIRVHVMPNGHYDYNEEDVYKFLNKDMKRKTYIYARVSTMPVSLRQNRSLISRTRFSCSSSSASPTATPSTACSQISPAASASRSGRACSTCWTMSLPVVLSVWS